MRIPSIIQAPMAGVQDWQLAAAASNAGALGSIPCALLSTELLQSSIDSFRKQSDGPLNLNFFAHHMPDMDQQQIQKLTHWRNELQRYYGEFNIADDGATPPLRQPFNDAALNIVLKSSPEFISFHFGLPAPNMVMKLKSAGINILASATTLDEARHLVDHGVDGIIAQGLEAGGHRGHFLNDDLSLQQPLATLLPQIVSVLDTPIIAAGGISNSAEVQKALKQGAVAVQIGSAFLLSHECNTSAVHRAALQSDNALTTTVTNIYSGRPARGIVNRLIKEQGAIRSDLPAFPYAASASTALRKIAESQNKGDFTPLWAGMNAHKAKPLAAAQIVASLQQHIDPQ